MFVNTSSTLPAHIQVYYELKLLETLEPRLTLASLGEKGRIPGGQGPTIRWTRLGKVNSSTSPLSPGVNPSSIAVTSVNIDSTLLACQAIDNGRRGFVAKIVGTTTETLFSRNIAVRNGDALSVSDNYQGIHANSIKDVGVDALNGEGLWGNLSIR